MNLPDIVNVALGLVVLYLLLSSIGSLILELVTHAAQYREEILYVTINRLLAGVPDTPWNLSRLVLNRVGQRLPEGKAWFGLAGLLRSRLVWNYTVVAPGRTDKESNRQDIVQLFWAHPKIRSLIGPGADAPPAMEAGTFAAVVIDIAVSRDAQGLLPDNRLALQRALAAPSEVIPYALLQTLRTHGLSSEIPTGATGENLWAPFRANIAAWFNEAGARSTDVYRGTMQRLLLGLGFALALLLNADTFRTIHLLSHDRHLSEAVAAYSETLVAERNALATGAAKNTPETGAPPAGPQPAPPQVAPPTPASTATGKAPDPAKDAVPSQPAATPALVAPPATTPADSGTTAGKTTGAAPKAGPAQTAAATPAEDLQKTRQELSADIARLRELEALGFPLGWKGPDGGFNGKQAADEWISHSPLYHWLAWTLAMLWLLFFKFVGLGATALAVSQGAPFWYGIMNRLVGLRKGQSDTSTDAGTAETPNAAPKAPTGSPTVPASALPLEIGHDLAAPATSFDVRKAYWLARSAAAAYSPSREIDALVKITWKFHECHFFDMAGTQGFCATDDQIMLIAFRGTELKELNDVFDDARVKLVALAHAAYQGAPNRTVHEGFQDALDRVWGDLSTKILAWAAIANGKKPRQIFITGHSLGGAIATLMFTRLASDPNRPVPTLYTFGCPKVGDDPFARELDRLYPERIFRLVNDEDIVPKLPPLPDFHHAGRELTFQPNGELRSEISGLSRVLRFAEGAVKDLTGAVKKTIEDHGMANYVARCEALAKKPS